MSNEHDGKFKGKLKVLDSRSQKRKAESEMAKKIENPIPTVSMENMIKNIYKDSKEVEREEAIKNAHSIYSQPQENLALSRRLDKFRLSYIEDYEEDEAIKQIEDLLGFERPRVAGYYMTVKLYIRPEEIVTFTDDKGVTKSLYMPDQVSAHDKYKSIVGLVIAQGPECYRGPRWEESLITRCTRKLFNRFMSPRRKFPYCKIGDWVRFPRNEGMQYNHRGLAVQDIPDNKIYGTIQDPSHVTRD